MSISFNPSAPSLSPELEICRERDTKDLNSVDSLRLTFSSSNTLIAQLFYTVNGYKDFVPAELRNQTDISLANIKERLKPLKTVEERQADFFSLFAVEITREEKDFLVILKPSVSTTTSSQQSSLSGTQVIRSEKKEAPDRWSQELIEWKNRFLGSLTNEFEHHEKIPENYDQKTFNRLITDISQRPLRIFVDYFTAAFLYHYSQNNGESSRNLFRLGRCQLKFGHFKEAKNCFEDASIGSEEPFPWTEIGELYLKMNQIDEALKSFKRAAQEDCFQLVNIAPTLKTIEAPKAQELIQGYYSLHQEFIETLTKIGKNDLASPLCYICSDQNEVTRLRVSQLVDDLKLTNIRFVKLDVELGSNREDYVDQMDVVDYIFLICTPDAKQARARDRAAEITSLVTRQQTLLNQLIGGTKFRGKVLPLLFAETWETSVPLNYARSLQGLTFCNDLEAFSSARYMCNCLTLAYFLKGIALEERARLINTFQNGCSQVVKANRYDKTDNNHEKADRLLNRLEGIPYCKVESLEEKSREIKPLTSLEKKIQDWLKSSKNSIGLAEMTSSAYIAGRAYRDLFNPEETFSIDQEITQFLESEKKVFLLLGDSGGGKSTFCLHLRETYSKQWQPGQPIPFYISLADPRIRKEIESTPQLIESLFKGFSDQEVQEIKTTQRLLFLFDGYDELSNQVDLYHKLRLTEWKKSQMIVTCRTQYLQGGKNDYRLYFDPESSLSGQQFYQEAILSPFNESEILSCLNSRSSSCLGDWSSEDLLKQIKEYDGLYELITNPFMLTIVLYILPEMIQAGEKKEASFTRLMIYEKFCQHWFEREVKKKILAESWKKNGKLSQAFTDFACQLAHRMWTEHCLTIEYEETVDFSGEVQSHGSLFAKFFCEENSLIRSGVPIRKTGDIHYSFIHKSLQEYFCAKYIVDQLGKGKVTPHKQQEDGLILSPMYEGALDFINQASLVEELAIIEFIAYMIVDSKEVQDRLFGVIERSKRDNLTTTAIAAANAITLLNAAAVSFSNRNFQGIRIPGANLAHAILFHTNMSYADLSDVKFYEAYLVGAILAHSFTQGIDFGRRPYLQLSKEAGEEFRITEDQFLWRIKKQRIIIYDLKTNYIPREIKVKSSEGIAIVSPSTKFLVKFVKSEKRNTSDSLESNKLMQSQIWNLKEDRPIHTINNYGYGKEKISFSSDDHYILYVEDDKKVILWDRISHKSITLHVDEFVSSVAISPEGKFILIGYQIGLIELLRVDKENFSRLYTHAFDHSSSIAAIQFFPDSIAALFIKDRRIYSFNLNGDVEMVSQHRTSCFAISPDSRFIAFGSVQGKIHVWSIVSKKEIFCFQDEDVSQVECLSFEKNGQWILSINTNGRVVYWNIKRLHSFKLKELNDFPHTQTTISRSGIYVGTTSAMEKSRVWDLTLYKEIDAKKHKEKKESSQLFSEDEWDLTVLSNCGITLPIRPALFGELIPLMYLDTSTAVEVIFSSNKKFCVKQHNGAFFLWNLESNNEVGMIKRFIRSQCFAFTPDSHKLLYGCIDGTAELWDLQSNECHLICTLNGSVHSVETSPDSSKGIVMGFKEMALIDLESKKTIHKAKYQAYCAHFHPKGEWFIYSHANYIFLKDIYGEKDSYYFCSTHTIIKVRFLPDGRHFLSIDSLPSIKLWQVFDEKERLAPALLWTSSSALTVQNMNMEGIIGMSDDNEILLERLNRIY